MTIENRRDIIHSRILKAFSPTHLEVIDESDKHIGHAGFQSGGRHFALIISSPHFNGLSRISAHRQIYDLLNDLIPAEIHALRIKII